MKSKAERFHADLIRDDKHNVYTVQVPKEVSAALGGKGRMYVMGTVDGFAYRETIFPYGGIHWLAVDSEILLATGKTDGGSVDVVIEINPNGKPTVVDMPEELTAILNKHPKAKEFFEGLSFTNRKEYAQWIASAKRDETKAARLLKTIEKLTSGLRNPSAK